MKTLEEILAYNLRWRMERLQMSQKELAKRSGLTAQTMNRYMNGKQYPRKSFLEALAKALNCTKEDLLGLSSSLTISQDILEALAAAPDSRLDDIRVLLRIPIQERARKASKKKP